jgi:hypothetical protein
LSGFPQFSGCSWSNSERKKQKHLAEDIAEDAEHVCLLVADGRCGIAPRDFSGFGEDS